MTTSRWHYAKALAEQLRINGVAEPRVRDIVAQVEAHTKATGEDPVEAFGQPVDYAAQWQRLSVRRLLLQVLLGVILAAGVLAIVKAATSSQRWTQPVPLRVDDLPTFGILAVLLGLMPWTVDLVLSRRRAARLGESTFPTEWPYRWAATLATFVVVSTAVWLLGEPSARTLFNAPRWLFLVAGLATLPILALAGPHPGMDSQPRPPGPEGSEPSWKARVRRAFVNR